ncbi:nicotinamide N-methyltransferase [Bombina bombina]|uniref:nicotinamide N-methyltransferase n=1 Tax=Bombina bombina TaxID=8345 RepID=UPI00235B1504|nr:nicotinamide N-methyltransferase [Bombina bombina]
MTILTPDTASQKKLSHINRHITKHTYLQPAIADLLVLSPVIMSDFTTQSDYEKEFDAELYLETYFHLGSGSLADDFIRFSVGNFHKIFTSGAVKGDKLIDIGTAPSIYHLLSACESFNEIIATWYTNRDLRVLEKWLKKEPGAFDWSSIVKHVCELEGTSGKEKEKEEKLRCKIQQILHCDVSKTNPLDPVVVPKADCLTAAVCLESACRNHDAYGRALKNISNLLKPGGHLLMTGDLGANYYEVGPNKVFSLSVNEKFLEKALKENGYAVRQLLAFGKPEDATFDTSDYEGFYFFHAQKI